MELKKFKITTTSVDGYMMVTYHNNDFKSVLNEFKTPLTTVQLNWILNLIPNDPEQIVGVITAKGSGKVKVEAVKCIGAEPQPAAAEIDFPVNEKIALWCRIWDQYTKDDKGDPIKYKTGAAEAGKIKALAVTPVELEFVLHAYFKSVEWFTMPKSISNFIKRYNEIRTMAYTTPVPKKKEFPLPFDPDYFNNLGTMDQRAYWDYLRVNGYKYIANAGRGGKWEKVYNT